jgi:hypothetical protein
MPEAWQMPFIDWRGPLEENAVWSAIDLALMALNRVLDRTPNSPKALIICGCSGVAKDFIVERALKARHLPLLPINTETESGLVKWAWRNRDAVVAVISDNAKLLSQEGMIDRIKLMIDPGRLHYETDEVLANMKRPTEVDKALMVMAAQDAKEVARIERMTERDPDIPESDFPTNFAVVWTSNNNYTDPKQIPPTLRRHWAALESRGINPRYIPDEPCALFTYTLHLIMECSMLRGRVRLKLEDTNAVLRAYIEHRANLKDLSPRWVVKQLAGLRQDLRNGNRLDQWERYLRGLLSPKVCQPALAALDVPLFQIPPK